MRKQHLGRSALGLIIGCGVLSIGPAAWGQTGKSAGSPGSPVSPTKQAAPAPSTPAPGDPQTPPPNGPRGGSNDSCATPQTIVGNGIFAFDNTTCTTGAEGQRNAICAVNGALGIENDEWFCWTATCTGLVSISTCGFTQVDTKIALYAGCSCPTDAVPAMCCNDNACGLQSQLRCDVICGHQYMIQIGKAPGTPAGSGSFQIDCAGPSCLQDPGGPECCGMKPSYQDQGYSTFTGQVMLMTAEVQNLSNFALTAFDIKNFASAPQNVHWNPANFRYNDPRWTKTNLGSVFGITLDDTGNAYVSHTVIYNSADPVGAIAGSTEGTIYKIANNTGTPSVFVNLPNRGPGLGNVSWDCEHDQIFASNFEDGRIYRVNAAGTFLSAYDHATGVVTPAVAGVIANEPGEPDGIMVPRGERVWAVKKHGNRLYYSLWNRDSRNISDTTDPLPPNQIWSVQLDGAGDFMAGTAVLEISMPGHGPYVYSESVSDINFSPDTPSKMLCSERNMLSDSSSYAHDARAIEFAFSGGSWTPSASNTNINGALYGFPVGAYGDSTNSAGGADYDTEPNGRIWTTGDAMHFIPDFIYGGAGMLTSGATVANDIFFDYNGDVTGVDKSQLGDLVIPCVRSCMDVTVGSILCNVGADGLPTGTYTVTYTITNHSGVAVSYVLLPNAPTSPHVIHLVPAIPDGGTGTVTTTIMGVAPGSTYCFDVVLADDQIRECCHGQVCVDIPDCSCIQFPRGEVVCDPATGAYTLNLTFQNLCPETLFHMFLIPLSPAGATVTPDYIPLPGVTPGSTFTLPPVQLAGVSAGDQLCMRISVHNDHLMECCSVVYCVTIPPPCTVDPCPADFNGDGTVNSQDFFDFLLAFFGADPSSDFNHDHLINSQDFFDFLAAFFTGCP